MGRLSVHVTPADSSPVKAGSSKDIENKELNSGKEGTGLHVIVLGPTGGPREDRVTGLLVRSPSTQWSSNSVIAVDAGTLLCGIISILEESNGTPGTHADGPFSGLPLPYQSAPANAAYILQKVIGAVLITHPHLDHVSALAINTPVLEAGSGPKTVAALPSVVSALKNHVFNDVIWPNLSDEDGGAGLITYQRLVEGGNPIMGRGEERGYIRTCEGLLARCFSVSHGRCKQRYHPETESHHRASSIAFAPDRPRLSMDVEAGAFGASLRTPLVAKEAWSTVESSAFFIRDQQTGTEIIIFGDVEPDSLSLEPRNKQVWDVAAPKIVSRQLRAIFIECSYSDDIEDDYLYGHLCPRHLIEELNVLARIVTEVKGQQGIPAVVGKRKRISDAEASTEPVSPKSKRSFFSGGKGGSKNTQAGSRRSTRRASKMSLANNLESIPDLQLPTSGSLLDPNDLQRELEIQKSSAPLNNHHRWSEMPLAGLSVYIIHIKDELTDGPHPSEKIMQELNDQGWEAGLGCEFHVPKRGESIFL